MTNGSAKLIDTHAHLDDDQFAGELDGVIDRASAAGIHRIINIGYRPARWRTTLSLADRYPCIAYTLGLHPHHVDEWSPATERALVELLQSTNPVAVGEIGLDYFRNLNPSDLQRVVFARQIEIATAHALPVVIHQRHAEEDLMHVLAKASPDLVCVLHSFDGTQRLLDFALERGYYIGVGGLMTRAASEELRSVLRRSPLERLLLETDAPYLVPLGVKERRNEPANLVTTVGHIARLFETSEQVVANVTTANAERVFGRAGFASIQSASEREQCP